MQEELDNRYPVLDQATFEIIDLPVTRFNPIGLNQIVDARDQYILVMGAIENGDHTDWRHCPVDAPQEIMCQFLRCRFLKTDRGNSERWDPAKDFPDCPVFSTRVETLQHHQQRVSGLGIQNFLEASNFFEIQRRRDFRFSPREGYALVVSRIDVSKQRHPRANRYAITLQGTEIRDRERFHLTNAGCLGDLIGSNLPNRISRKPSRDKNPEILGLGFGHQKMAGPG